MKPVRWHRRRNLPALLALGLMVGSVTAGGARFAAENTRLEARIRQLESRSVSGENAAPLTLPQTLKPAPRRPDPRSAPSPCTAARGVLHLLSERKIEIVSYSLEAQKALLTLSGSARPEALISFFGSLHGGFPELSFEEFEIARKSGERTLLFGFSLALGTISTQGPDRTSATVNGERVSSLFPPPPGPLPPERGREACAKSPEEPPPLIQPGTPHTGRYIGSAVIGGTLRLYLMDETKMELTRVTPGTERAESMTERIETETVEKTGDESQIPFSDLYPFDPLPAASDRLRQPRP